MGQTSSTFLHQCDDRTDPVAGASFRKAVRRTYDHSEGFCSPRAGREREPRISASMQSTLRREGHMDLAKADCPLLFHCARMASSTSAASTARSTLVRPHGKTGLAYGGQGKSLWQMRLVGSKLYFMTDDGHLMRSSIRNNMERTRTGSGRFSPIDLSRVAIRRGIQRPRAGQTSPVINIGTSSADGAPDRWQSRIG